MFNFLKNLSPKSDPAKSEATGVVISCSVGEGCPFGAQPLDSQASISLGGLLYHIEYISESNQRMIEALDNTNLTRSVLVAPKVGWPSYTFVFEPGIIISGMLYLTDEEADIWANSETNGVHIILVNAATNKILKIRTLGLDPDYRQYLTDAIQVQPNISQPEAAKELAKISTIDCITAGRGWLWDKDREEFREVAENGLLSLFQPR